jgi:hypothetical protein
MVDHQKAALNQSLSQIYQFTGAAMEAIALLGCSSE